MMSITNIDDDNDAPLGHVQATFTRLPIITGGSNMNEFILGEKENPIIIIMKRDSKLSYVIDVVRHLHVDTSSKG
jgi:hypothetical protein